MKTVKKLTRKNSKEETVVIRMADYYPDYKGEQEYCEISKEFYDKFYAPAPKHTISENGTISIKIKELYPHLDVGESTITIDRSLYNAVIENRKKNHTVTIRIKDLYPEDKSEYEYIEISEVLYKEIVKSKKKEKALELQDYRHKTTFEFDENITGAVEAIYTCSSENDTQYEILVNSLFSQYSGELKTIALLYFVEGFTATEIANILKKNRPAIWKSIRKAKAIIESAGKDYFF